MRRIISRGIPLIFAAMMLIVPIHAAAGEGLDVIWIVDLADSPALSAEAPWLGWPCMNPAHRYYKPLSLPETTGDTFPATQTHTEPDTTVRYAFTRRFLGEAGARGWRPWENHYHMENGAWYPVRDPARAGCYGRGETARALAAEALRGVMLREGGVRAGVIAVGATGDARFDLALTHEADAALHAVLDMPCAAVRDRASALLRAAAMLNRRRGEEAEREAIVAVISGGPSDAGPYEARAAEAAALLTGEKGEAAPVLWWGGLGEAESRFCGARLVLAEIDGGRDGLFAALERDGAPRVSLCAGDDPQGAAEALLALIPGPLPLC